MVLAMVWVTVWFVVWWFGGSGSGFVSGSQWQHCGVAEHKPGGPFGGHVIGFACGSVSDCADTTDGADS